MFVVFEINAHIHGKHGRLQPKIILCCPECISGVVHLDTGYPYSKVIRGY